MKRLGIVAPTMAEARSLKARPIGLWKPISSRSDAVLRISGMGPENAGSAARALIEVNATALISWGTAGGLRPQLRPGDLILPEKVTGSDGTVYQTDPLWRCRLIAHLNHHMQVHTVTLAESISILTCSEEKKTLSIRTGAAAVDMESAALGHVAAQHGIPFIVIRAIVDPAEMDIPRGVLGAVDESGRLRPFNLIAELFKRPGELLPLLRLGRHFRTAQTTLATVARLAGEDLLMP